MNTDQNPRPYWKRIVFSALKSPINTFFILILFGYAFYIYGLGNDAFFHKIQMIGIFLLWMLWLIARYVLVLLLVFGLIGVGAYLYYDYTHQEQWQCEEDGGYWNKKTKICEEKRTFWQQVQDKWDDYRAKAELLNKISSSSKK